VLNAWDSGGRIVVDLMQYDEPPLFPHPDGTMRLTAPEARLVRWTIDPNAGTDAIRQLALDDTAGEFPRIDDRRSGLRHRFGAIAGRSRPGAGLDSLVWLNPVRGTRRRFNLPEGDGLSEPAFVPRDEGPWKARGGCSPRSGARPKAAATSRCSTQATLPGGPSQRYVCRTGFPRASTAIGRRASCDCHNLRSRMMGILLAFMPFLAFALLSPVVGPMRIQPPSRRCRCIHHLSKDPWRIECPMLITEPANEAFWPGQSRRLHDLLTCPRTLVPFSAAKGADLHCEPAALGLRELRVFNWLDKTLA